MATLHWPLLQRHETLDTTLPWYTFLNKVLLVKRRGADAGLPLYMSPALDIFNRPQNTSGLLKDLGTVGTPTAGTCGTVGTCWNM